MQLRKYLAAPFAALLLTGASFANAAAPIDVTWNPSAAGITTAGAVHVRQYINQHLCGYRHYGRWHRLLGAGVCEADRVLEQRVAHVDSDGGISRGHGLQPVHFFHSYRDSDRGHSFHRQLQQLELFTAGCSRRDYVPGQQHRWDFRGDGCPDDHVGHWQPDSPGSTSLTGTPVNLLPAAEIYLRPSCRMLLLQASLSIPTLRKSWT